MRGNDHKFFHGIDVEDVHGLVDGAYDLAYTFKQDPATFLAKPLDELLDDLEGLARLTERLNKASPDD